MTRDSQFNPAVWELARELALVDPKDDGTNYNPEFEHFYKILREQYDQ